MIFGLKSDWISDVAVASVAAALLVMQSFRVNDTKENLKSRELKLYLMSFSL